MQWFAVLSSLVKMRTVLVQHITPYRKAFELAQGRLMLLLDPRAVEVRENCC